MRANFLFKLLLGGIAFYSSASFATFYGCTSTYYVAASFPAFYKQKAVKSVAVHAGVLLAKQTPVNQPPQVYWEPTTIINYQVMDKVGEDHFFTKYTTLGRRGGGDGGPTVENQGPVIQYWIDFEDGSTFIDEVRMVNVSGYYGYGDPAAQMKAISEYNAMTDAFQTVAVETHQGSGCPF